MAKRSIRRKMKRRNRATRRRRRKMRGGAGEKDRKIKQQIMRFANKTNGPAAKNEAAGRDRSLNKVVGAEKVVRGMGPPEKPPSKTQVNKKMGRSGHLSKLNENIGFTESVGFTESEHESETESEHESDDDTTKFTKWIKKKQKLFGKSDKDKEKEIKRIREIPNSNTQITNFADLGLTIDVMKKEKVQERYRFELDKLKEKREEIDKKFNESKSEKEKTHYENIKVMLQSRINAMDHISFETMEELNKYATDSNVLIKQNVTEYSLQPAAAASTAATPAGQAESTPNQGNQQGGPNLEDQKQKLVSEIQKDLAVLKEERTNITTKKDIYKSDKNILKVLDGIDRSYKNAVDRVSTFLDRVRNMDMRKINESTERYDGYKGQRDTYIIEPQRIELRDLENKYNNGSPGDGGVNGNNSGSVGTTAPSTALVGTEAEEDAERKKEENNMEADIKTNLLEVLKYIKDNQERYNTLDDKQQWLFSVMANKNIYLPENFGETNDKKIDTKFYGRNKMAVPDSVMKYNILQEQTTDNEFDKIADGYSSSAANSSEIETGSQPTPKPEERTGASNETGRLEAAIKAQEAKKAKEAKIKEMEHDKKVSDKNIQMLLKTLLSTLKETLDTEKDQLSPEVGKFIIEKKGEIDVLLNNKEDLDIDAVLKQVDDINKEVDELKEKDSMLNETKINRICEQLKETFISLRPPAASTTGGRKTRNKKKKKKSKAKKNKTRRRRRSKA